MILDYRVYATLYALWAVAYCGNFVMLSRAEPGRDDFRARMDAGDRYFAAVMVAIVVVGLANFLDWLWS